MGAIDTTVSGVADRRRCVVLCGGVGAARFLSGLVRVVDPADVTAIVNVADDETFHGLHVSPDLDTVLYTLAGVVDQTRGWGVRDDTYAVQQALSRLGRDTWFQLGDADLATHIHRTALLREGHPLSDVTARLARALGVATRVLPASDDRQATKVLCDGGWLDFQEWFVHRATRDRVREVRFEGDARPAPGVREAIAAADVIVLAPSNPFVSIGPILAVAGVREAIERAAAPVVAVSPIVGGEALKGPAAAMLESLGHEVSALGVARIYRGLVDVCVVDERDASLARAIADLGIGAVVTRTIMSDRAAKESLARAVLDAASGTVGAAR
ncbi:MAG: 2-phospho-L-lactate transferase [Chloroflexota bacterium]|nr:2-phospho-L-lactate transferase [Chloroflexota bacterium]